jgi:hypothetical protein
MQKSFRRILMPGALVGVAMMAGCATVNTSGPATAIATGSGAQATATAPASTQTPAQAAAQKLAALAVTVDKNCTVGQPFLASMIVIETDPAAIAFLKDAQDRAGKVCTVAAAIAHPVSGAPLPTLDLATVKAFADSQLPGLLTLVKTSSLTEPQKTAANLAITGMQAALLLAVVNTQ